MKAEVVEVEDPITTSVIREVEPEPELGISPPPPVSAPPAQFESRPSLSDKPLLLAVQTARLNGEHKRTPRGRTPNFLTPLGSPIRRALQMTKLDAHDAWLPITESRNGNLYYAAFHTLCSGIGIQALVLPVALTILGWTWGVISLTVAFFWQLYTLWVLVKLHESTETGMRYSRYLHLFNAAFGERMGKIFALFPIMYLAGGTCVALIVVGGSTSKLFFQIVCGEGCTAKPLTTVEWYLVFASAAVVLSQLPNLNSIAGVSLVGATTAIAYCTIMWVVAVTEGRLDGVSYNPIKEEDNMAWIFSILNALGIIAFAFRGHNLILEIQGTMPSYEKKPSHIPMWRGVKIAYLIIALCLYPLAIGGYWAYGHKIPPNGGMLTAIYQFHGRDTSQATLGLTSLFVIINAVSSFQIYGMPMFDDMESKFTVRMNRPCPWWLRALFRVMFGYGCFFVAVAIPFLGSLAGLIGGMAVPITFAYPSFMWLKIKKPKRQSFMWYLNWGLGISGTILSVLLIAAGVYVVIDTGIEMGMSEVVEVRISPRNGLPEVEEASPAISASPFQLHYSPSLTRTPKSPFTSRMMTPIASPMKKAITSMQVYLEEVAHFTKLNPQEDWLPITESRNGNLYYSAFHTLSSGIGAQALVLPLAFTALGWTWGILCLSLVFIWQLYTLWVLIQLHEPQPGTRYSRYLQLSMAAFGEKMGKILALFPIMYLSGGTCVALIMIGGGTMKLFFEIVCADTCKMNPLSTIEWYLVFTCCAIIIAQLPNLNSIAGVSLVGAITAISYCTLIWVLSISRGRPGGVSYEPLKAKSDVARACSVLSAIGVIAFAFRGHNVVLEIQGTMPSSPQKPSRKAMWAGVKFAYLAIGMCLFPLAVGGYWEYGDLIPANQGMLSALYRYHGHNTSRALLGLTSLLVVVNSLSSFQIYAMPVFDNLEFRYTSSKNRPCPRWLRSGFRVFFGCLALFISVAFPFLPSLAGLIGGIALPITLAYPCLMWILIKKPRKYGATWLVNGVLGVSGMVLSVLIVAAAIWSIVTIGIPVHFFKPK